MYNYGMFSLCNPQVIKGYSLILDDIINFFNNLICSSFSENKSSEYQEYEEYREYEKYKKYEKYGKYEKFKITK